MNKKRKIKLSFLVIFSLAILLVALTVSLSSISINSIKFIGKKTVEIDGRNTRDNAKVFFLEITRRSAGSYSIYFEGVKDFVNIISAQVKEVLAGRINSINKNKQINFRALKGSEFYFVRNKAGYDCFYFGDKNSIKKAAIQAKSLITLIPLLKSIYDENSTFFQCVWIEANGKINIEYPKYREYYNMNGDVLKKYFEDILQEYSPNKKGADSGIIWTKPYKDITGYICLDAYQKIYDEEGNFLAAIGIELDFEKIAQVMSNNSLLSDRHNSIPEKIKSIYNKMEGFTFIIDSQSSIIAFPKDRAKLLSLPPMEYSKLKSYPEIFNVNLKDSMNPKIRKLALEIEENQNGVKTVSLNGENYIIAYCGIPGTKVTLCFAAAEKSLTTSMDKTVEIVSYTEDKMIIRFIIIVIIFLFLFIILSIIVFRYFLLNPLYKIRNEVKKLGDGNFEISLSETGVAEISELSATFNALTIQLKTYVSNLESEVKQRQTIETELEIAGRLQKSVLPNITDEYINDKFELYAKLIPAKEMSGDFYDFFYVKENTLGIVLADVSGKGITAAFYMSMAKAIIKEACLKSQELDTGLIVSKVNNILCKSVKTPMFLTMYLAFYNIETGEIIYTNAGHHDYIIVNASGEIICSGAGNNNIFVGFFEDSTFKSERIQLKPQETFILYTDGITEAMDPDKKQFGEEKLVKLITEKYTSNLNHLGKSILDEVMHFQSGSKFDDITLMMLKRNL